MGRDSNLLPVILPKLRHIKFGRQDITQTEEYNIQNTAEVSNQEANFTSTRFVKARIFVTSQCYPDRGNLPWLRFFLTWLRFFLPWLRFFRAFSSVVSQMPGWNTQRRGTARTLPNFCVALCIFCVVLCIFCVVLCVVCICVLNNCHRVATQL
jgi:hypothetical protein